MVNIKSENAALLAKARERGSKAVGEIPIPPGLDQFTAYVGLIGNALELGKLIATQERDLKVIESHYTIEMSRIAAAFKETEAAMMADFTRDSSLRDKTFQMIEKLIEAGQYEIAGEFHKRMIDSFDRPALEAIVEHRNTITRAGGTHLALSDRQA